MELKFQQVPIPCLHRVLEQSKDVEMTQEIKLPEGMPDIGNVICAWGQVLIRGKEWRQSRVGASGGVQGWILYAPEDGSDPKMVEVWMPFQTRWEIPEELSEGKLCLIPQIRLVDARTVAARRLMARACVSLYMSAWIKNEAVGYAPGELPDDVRLKTAQYRVNLPCELGEKAFAMEEELVLPSPKAEKLLRYSLQLQITEARVMAGRVVFRGNGLLQLLCCTEEGIQSSCLDVPFAQYAELENEYGPDATVCIFPALTSLDAELGEEKKLRLKAGLVAQYIVCQDKELMAVEDAYSTQRELKLQLQTMVMPDLRWMPEMEYDAQCNWTGEGRMVDCVFYPDHPGEDLGAGSGENRLTGRFHILYYDAEDHLRGSVCKWEMQQPMNMPEDPAGILEAEAVMKNELTAQLRLRGMAVDQLPVECVCGLDLGDAVAKDPNRPSVILRKAGNATIWQLAKSTGSTEEAIRIANHLEGDSVAPDQILLIPVL